MPYDISCIADDDCRRRGAYAACMPLPADFRCYHTLRYAMILIDAVAAMLP